MILFNYLKKIFLVLAVLGILALSFSFVQAVTYDFPAEGINTSIPGMNTATQANPDPVGIIANLFQFALLIGGLLAFVMIVYGGIEYAASGDSGSGQKEAKDRIQQALLGLLLLAGSFILLNTINPELTKLEFPTLTKIKQSSVSLLNLNKPDGVCPQGMTLQGCIDSKGEVGGYCHQGTCHSNNEGPFLGGVPAAKTAGGRCIDNQCNAGLFCHRNNTCYTKEQCLASDNDPNNSFSINRSCANKYVQSYPNNFSLFRDYFTCTNGACEQVDTSLTPISCSSDPDRCSSGESCVGGICKLDGTEGAKCRDGNPTCLENGVECVGPSIRKICVRRSAEDIACGDQIGRCETGSCQMDRVNIGKYTCSTTPGADGVCPAQSGVVDQSTLQKCNASYPGVGGYCHNTVCWKNSDPVGPFPGIGPFPSNP